MRKRIEFISPLWALNRVWPRFLRSTFYYPAALYIISINYEHISYSLHPHIQSKLHVLTKLFWKTFIVFHNPMISSPADLSISLRASRQCGQYGFHSTPMTLFYTTNRVRVQDRWSSSCRRTRELNEHNISFSFNAFLVLLHVVSTGVKHGLSIMWGFQLSVEVR